MLLSLSGQCSWVSTWARASLGIFSQICNQITEGVLHLIPNEHIIILKWKWPCQWLQCPCHCRMKWFFEKCPSKILPISVLFLKKLESRFWDQITKRYLCNFKSKHSINIYIYKWMNLIESKTAHKSTQNWTTGSEGNDWPCVSLRWVKPNTNFSLIPTVTTSMSWAWFIRKSFHGTSKMDAFPISCADVARFREVKSFGSMTKWQMNPLKWQNDFLSKMNFEMKLKKCESENETTQFISFVYFVSDYFNVDCRLFMCALSAYVFCVGSNGEISMCCNSIRWNFAICSKNEWNVREKSEKCFVWSVKTSIGVNKKMNKCNESENKMR